MADMVMHPSYQRIIGMGEDAIPLILNELDRQPDHWFWALHSLLALTPYQNIARATSQRWLVCGSSGGGGMGMK